MMMGYGYGGFGHSALFGTGMLAGAFVLFAAAIIWALVWKGLGLWHAARHGHHWWFAAFLVVNTLGILEIIYLFFVIKLHWRQLFSKHIRAEHRKDN